MAKYFPGTNIKLSDFKGKDSKKEDVAAPVESVQQAAPARKETLLKIKQELETLLEILRR